MPRIGLLEQPPRRLADMSNAAIWWIRRDLRLRDQPALLAAAADGEVLPAFVLDDALLGPSGEPRRSFLAQALTSLDQELREVGPGLVIRRGDPVEVLPQLALETDARSVHISADYGPYGRRRDEAVRVALGDVPLIATGSPYAVAPGRVLTQSGRPFQVFTPFYRAWLQHGWRPPADSDPRQVSWRGAPSLPLPEADAELRLPDASEAGALRAWHEFHEGGLANYPAHRDRPDLAGTSRLSPYLRWGLLHPRTLLADLGPDDEVFRKELAWREFYAAVLAQWPESARAYFRPELAGLPYVEGDLRQERLDAWQQGRTGYPIVDAAMRQLRHTGWMHNRLRMIVASFLVKDLQIEWQLGARHFMRLLVDGDLASNQHGWQWAAGSGTDAAPYFRIFNPTSQGKRYDPDGEFVRSWIPELAHLPGSSVHEPWTAEDGYAHGYPIQIVDHSEQRTAALEAYAALRR